MIRSSRLLCGAMVIAAVGAHSWRWPASSSTRTSTRARRGSGRRIHANGKQVVAASLPRYIARINET